MEKTAVKTEKKGEEKNGLFGLSAGSLIAVAAVALLAIALIYYGTVQRQGNAAPEKIELPLESEAARLLFSSYNASMSLSTYSLNYSTDENGAKATYYLADNGIERFAYVKGGFGEVAGYFVTGNESGDIACLAYGGEMRCAEAGNDSSVRGVANNIKGLFLTKKQRQEKLIFVTKLISSGAAKPSKEVSGEKVGPFEARKASYTLNYRELTVQQLMALGISPEDTSIYSVSNYVMTYWVDKKTGLIVKSKETYDEDGRPRVFVTEYAMISLSKPAMPQKPLALASAQEFLQFYSKSAQEYTGKEKCLALPKAEQDGCFKGLASERRDPEVCKLIENKTSYESCVLIIAQLTASDLLCERLDLLKDECYIAIVAETGNADLCKKVSDQGLISSCADAVAEGEKKADLRNVALLHAVSKKNCAADSDCMAAGKFGEFCVPKNTTALPINDQSPFFTCFANLTCGCADEYCGFAKNESHYKCISDTEEAYFREYINSLVDSKNNSSG